MNRIDQKFSELQAARRKAQAAGEDVAAGRVLEEAPAEPLVQEADQAP